MQECNPATGDVVLRNVRGTVHLSFGVLWPYLMSEDVRYDPPIFFPVTAEPPPPANVGRTSTGELVGLSWKTPSANPRTKMQFDSLVIPHAVPPNVPVDRMQFNYDLGGTVFYTGQIRIVPEPSPLSVAGVSLLSLAALRRRK
jgi:hypothetical protein